MKTKYLYVKNGKIELTPAELEEIMKEKYNEGYEAAKILYNTSCAKSTNWWECPYKYSSGCPYGSITAGTTATSLQTDKAQPIDITYFTGTADANTATTSKADFTHALTMQQTQFIQ
jgi:hypothetical protein